MEEYARQRVEEQAILKAARQARQEQEKSANKITAEEAAKIQERVSWIWKPTSFMIFPVTAAAQCKKGTQWVRGYPVQKQLRERRRDDLPYIPKES